MNAVQMGLAASVVVLAAAAVALAAEPSALPAPAPAPVTPPVYRPVMSDLMNGFIQPRHIKLSLAAKAGNWEYAEYERHNIGGAMARTALAIPVYKGMPLDSLIAAFVTPQLDGLATAIKARDPAAFTVAYEALTTGCNQCHQATGHAFVVMQTPGYDAFPDQVFKPE